MKKYKNIVVMIALLFCGIFLFSACSMTDEQEAKMTELTETAERLADSLEELVELNKKAEEKAAEVMTKEDAAEMLKLTMMYYQTNLFGDYDLQEIEIQESGDDYEMTTNIRTNLVGDVRYSISVISEEGYSDFTQIDVVYQDEDKASFYYTSCYDEETDEDEEELEEYNGASLHYYYLPYFSDSLVTSAVLNEKGEYEITVFCDSDDDNFDPDSRRVFVVKYVIKDYKFVSCNVTIADIVNDDISRFSANFTFNYDNIDTAADFAMIAGIQARIESGDLVFETEEP